MTSTQLNASLVGLVLACGLCACQTTGDGATASATGAGQNASATAASGAAPTWSGVSNPTNGGPAYVAADQH